MVLNVSSLLKTVKAVEDEHTRGTRAMEATVEAITQEIRVGDIYSKEFYRFGAFVVRHIQTFQTKLNQTQKPFQINQYSI